jgi:hypothetical protein
MNERIEKLAEQAAAYAWEQIDLGANFDEQPRYFAEKFAELIVAECANELLKWRQEPFPMDAESAARIIKQHFGVK